MAGDWIKMRQDLGEDPAVVMISTRIDIQEDAVVGKLHRLWCWADKHTTDGTAPAITEKWVDRYVSQPGFAAAMREAGWISFTESGVVFPNFDRHNGQSAKTRAEATIRQRLSRANRDEGVTGVERTAIPRPFARHVLQRDGYQCVYCGRQSTQAKEESRKSILSIDHIIPESRGGSAAVENLACCCKQCNNEKNDRTPEEWGLLPTFLQDGVTYVNGQMSHKNRDTTVTNSSPEKRREEKKENNIVTPDGVSVEVWNAFLKVRKAKKAPMSDLALAGIKREADAAGWTLEDALQECVTRGWQAFKADWVAQKTPSGQTNPLLAGAI